MEHLNLDFHLFNNIHIFTVASCEISFLHICLQTNQWGTSYSVSRINSTDWWNQDFSRAMQRIVRPRSAALAVVLWVSATFVYCVETAKETAIVAMKCKSETVTKLSNGTILMILSDQKATFQGFNDRQSLGLSATDELLVDSGS